MKNISLYTVITISAYFAGMVSWILFRRLLIRPYAQIKKAHLQRQQNKKDYGPWSIGVCEGPTPFDITEPTGNRNPVLSAKDIDDMDARFVADPFMVSAGGRFHLFFEAVERKFNRGAIGHADSQDGKTWRYKQIVIQEDFHLSYPHVFVWNGDYYLMPESAEDFSVRLYKATSFPDKWAHVGNLLNGYRYLDPTIFRHKDKWWMFVATGGSDVLNLYYSDDLLHGWQPHPMNPIVKRNGHIARPGGRVITYSDKLYRFAQDDDPQYGLQVFAFEITALSEISYQEKIVSEKPVVAMTGRGWNAAGMHTVDLQQVGDKWIGVVDGADRQFR